MNAVCENCGYIDHDREAFQLFSSTDCPECGGRLGIPI